MQSGSLVALKEPLTKKEKDTVVSSGYNTWPVKENVYEIEEMWKPEHKQWEMSVSLVEYPMTSKGRPEFDSELWIEVLPAGEAVIKEVSPKQEELVLPFN